MESNFLKTNAKKSVPKSLGPKSSKEDEFKKMLVKELCECGSRSSVHGIPALANGDTSSVIKLVWIFFMLASWAYFIYLFVIITRSYNANEVITSVSLGYEAPSDFPGKMLHREHLRNTISRLIFGPLSG